MAEAESFLSRKRIACAERRISSISAGDVRVRVTGTVIDRDDERVVVDDGTGRISASFEAPVAAEPGQLVRVFGRVVPVEGGFELQAEALQDMTGLDIELYRRVSQLSGPGKE